MHDVLDIPQTSYLDLLPHDLRDIGGPKYVEGDSFLAISHFAYRVIWPTPAGPYFLEAPVEKGLRSFEDFDFIK